MTDPILTKIRSQQAACTLYALRAWAREERRWDEDRHGAVFAEKMRELSARWR